MNETEKKKQQENATEPKAGSLRKSIKLVNLSSQTYQGKKGGNKLAIVGMKEVTILQIL